CRPGGNDEKNYTRKSEPQQLPIAGEDQEQRAHQKDVIRSVIRLAHVVDSGVCKVSPETQRMPFRTPGRSLCQNLVDALRHLRVALSSALEITLKFCFLSVAKISYRLCPLIAHRLAV